MRRYIDGGYGNVENRAHGHFRLFAATGWEEQLEMGRLDSNRTVTPNKCRFCKTCAKTPHAPETFYGTAMVKVAWNEVVCPRE